MPAAAPRIDDRLVRFIQGSPLHDSAADVTRAAGALAWELGLVRPSYEQVRVLARLRAPQRSRLQTAAKVFDTLTEYPGPGLADWYRRYKRGAF